MFVGGCQGGGSSKTGIQPTRPQKSCEADAQIVALLT
jgi:hypothetical protein